MGATEATDADGTGVWRERFRVRSYEADARGIVTPASICNYLQEAAGNHARALEVSVEQLHERNLTWMLSRLRLQVERLPRWRETVEVETWPSGVAGILAVRDFILRVDHVVAARASTAWLLIDLVRRRPTRLTEEIQALRLPHRDPAIPFTNERVPTLVQVTSEEEVVVRWSDMDVNEHTNNVRYVTWAMDALPEPMLADARLEALAVDFLGETRAPDVLRIRSSTTGRLPHATFRSELVLAATDKPVARVESAWSGSD